MTTQELWQSQSVEAPRINIDYLRARATDTLRIGRRRRLFESSFWVIAVSVAGLIWSWYTDPWMRAGGAWLVMAGGIYSWHWWRAGSSGRLPADLGAIDTLRFHRGELDRQRALYQGLWMWMIPLFVPVLALLIYGRYLLAAGDGSFLLSRKVPVVVAGLCFMIGFTRYRAAKLRREIELLDLMAR